MSIEIEKTYASKGVAGAALGTGIAGLSLGVLNGMGALGGLFGANRNQEPACSEQMLVNRYELAQNQEISSLKSQIALRDANTYNDQKSLELYKYIDGELREVRAVLAQQAVTNQKTADSFALAAADLQAAKRELSEQIKMEAEKRCCGDNSIVTYANATFYPKQIADITTGTTTTAQMLYNPIPNCGTCCNR